MIMYSYLKALHIIFVVTWFAGLFYMPRLFIYATEAGNKTAPEQKILREQFSVMMKRLWYGITWPSAVLTLILGIFVMFNGGWNRSLFDPAGRWLLIKLCFVILLYVYHFFAWPGEKMIYMRIRNALPMIAHQPGPQR